MNLFPSIEPYRHEYLKVSEIHTIHFEECGNPNGKPVVFLHGGPGGGIEPYYRQFFDPAFFRIILIDQRGSGKSTPFAELRENTTWDLVADIEKIRVHLNIEKWLVFGGSWGSTLALVYAITHPEKVTHMILRGIFLCRPEELQWFYQEGASWIFPDFWESYRDLIPVAERNDFIKAYYKRLTSTDDAEKLKAAQVWSIWEASVSKLIPSNNYMSHYEDPQKALPFARIECHYFINNAFLPSNNYILENADKIKNISCDIVQGRYDVVCPAKSAWELHRLLPLSKLTILPQSGHSASEVAMISELLAAVEKYRLSFC